MPPTTHFAPTPQKLSNSSLGSTSVISVTALAGVPAFVRNTFGERLLNRVNQAAMLDIEAIEDQDCFIPHITMTTFVDAVAKFSGEENFGMIVAPHLSITSYGCWGEYILGAPTLGAAIGRGIATIGFHSKDDALSLDIVDDLARVSYASAAKGHDGYRHVACGAAGVVVSMCKAFLLPAWGPHVIDLDIPRPLRPALFEDAFGCPVRFDAPRVSVYFPARLLRDGPAGHALRSLVTPEDLARARVECHTLSCLRDVIAQQIWSQVLTGHVSIESAARSVNTSVRPLQRELNREGADFRKLANTMRSRRAIELLLHTSASITHDSTVLGYSAPAHFARAFRNATGMSPQEFRRCHALVSTT